VASQISFAKIYRREFEREEEAAVISYYSAYLNLIIQASYYIGLGEYYKD
jgi:hypothetical protein